MQSGTSFCPWASDKKPRDLAMLMGSMLFVGKENTTSLVEGLKKIDANILQATSTSEDVLVSINFKQATWKRNTTLNMVSSFHSSISVTASCYHCLLTD